MRTFEVITSCNAKGLEQYGRNCIDSFVKHWPEEVRLTLYTENFEFKHPRVKTFSLENIKWLGEFKTKHALDKKRNGMGGQIYNFQYDAVRFSHKVAAYTHRFREPDARDIGIWLDADCITHAPVTREWLEGLIAEDATIAWLNRDHQYPECGFIMFNNTDQRVSSMLSDLVYAYETGQIFEMAEQHDSYIFQQMVHQYMRSNGIKVWSLSGKHTDSGHPFINGPLGACLDHLKGTTRKEIGHSNPSRDLVAKRTERYWLPS